MDTCCHCKKPIEEADKGPKDVCMEYDGLKFRGWKSGFSCSACIREQMAKNYELLKKEKILTRKELKPYETHFEQTEGVPYWRVMDQGIDIDWLAFDKYLLLMGEYKESRDVVGSLREIGILSLTPQDNYAIIAGGMFVHLFRESSYSFFAREKDAKEVSSRMYERAEYPWGVIKVNVSMESIRGVV